MDIKKENISDTQVKLTITVEVEEMDKFLKRAAKKISLKSKIKGFRPGKANYEIIKQRFGEMAIYQEALNSIIDHTLIDAIHKEEIDFVGRPDITVEKLAPQNPLVYTAILDLRPTVSLPKNWKDLKVKVKKEKVSKDKVKNVLDDLILRHAKEVLKQGKAEKGDKVFVDIELSFDNVVPEDGVMKNFEIILGDNKMIPGFEDELIGLKKDDKKEFELVFPKKYFKKEYAGKKAKFKVKVNNVFKIEKPKKDDEFAKIFGFDKLKDLEKSVEETLQADLDSKNELDAEVEMFDLLIKKSKFSKIPDSMIQTEIDTMIGELQKSIESNGLEFNDYLEHLKKSVEDLRKDFYEDAVKRVKSALILREVIDKENLEVSEKEVKEQIDSLLKQEQLGEVQDKEYLRSKQFEIYIKGRLLVQKAANLLRDFILEK